MTEAFDTGTPVTDTVPEGTWLLYQPLGYGTVHKAQLISRGINRNGTRTYRVAFDAHGTRYEDDVLTAYIRLPGGTK